METAFSAVFGNMVMFFAIMGIGYALNRFHLVPNSMEPVLSKLIVYVFIPALTLYTFMTECTPENLRENASLILYGAGFALLSILIATLLSGKLAHGDHYLTRVFRYSLAIPNTGGIGTPLVMALFGTAGLFKFSLFLLPTVLTTYLWGIEQLIPQEEEGRHLNFKKLANSATIAMAVGMILGVFRVVSYLPSFIPETIGKLGNCYPLLSLLLVGYVIADYRPRDIVDLKTDGPVTFLRLAAIPVFFILLLILIKAPQDPRVMTALAFGCPCGMNTVVYAAAYGKDCRAGAGLLLMTNILAVITLPLVSLLV